METLEKYSVEWFREEAKNDKYVELTNKAESVRKDFLEQFSTDALKELEGKELLSKLFYDGTGNKTNLCYTLENNPICRDLFGGILGGSAFKFGLFFYKKENTWTTGSPSKPDHITEEDAIKEGSKIRDYLVNGAEIIEANAPYEKVEDYENLYNKLSDIPIINNIWVMKYWQMLFPDFFPIFYGTGIQNALVKFIGAEPSDNPYVRMGLIKLFIRKCGISNTAFGDIYYKVADKDKNVPSWSRKKQNEIDNQTSSVDSEIRSVHYWLYSPGTNATSWDYVYKNGIMGLGWDYVTDLNDFESQDSIKDKIVEKEGNETNDGLCTSQKVRILLTETTV